MLKKTAGLIALAAIAASICFAAKYYANTPEIANQQNKFPELYLEKALS